MTELVEGWIQASREAVSGTLVIYRALGSGKKVLKARCFAGHARLALCGLGAQSGAAMAVAMRSVGMVVRRLQRRLREE